MTAGTAGAAQAARVPRLDDAGRAALRRAVRVTAAGCLGFYLLLYGLAAPTAAVYAVFSVVSLGALSDVQGAPAARTRTYLAALLVGAVLVTAGTWAAVSTATAAAGMLAVGFAVAYAGVGGPRAMGVSPGLQLFYLLPCFPPFAPDTLDERLAGVAVGGLLLVAADRLVLAAPAPPPPGERLAVAAERVAAYAAALRSVLADPGAGTDAERVARRAALDAAARLRLADVPPAQRPVGPGVRDRALLAAATATRVATGRSVTLADLLAQPGRTPHPQTAALVEATGEAFAAVAAKLRGGPGGRSGHDTPDRPTPADTSGLDAALAAYLAERGRHLADRRDAPPDLRAGLAAVTVAEQARIAVLGVDAFLGAPPPPPAVTPKALWFLHETPLRLLAHRLRAQLTPRSVYLQNAARLALGLAAARVVAGVLDLSHGFWVLLATLSLMRTSAVAGRAVLPRAFAGTAVGAVVAGALLYVLGGDVRVFAWALPPVMVLAFVAGPLFGVAAGQAGFTVVVALLFAQVAPTDWRLAEVRLTDVVVGGLIGAVIGAAVWPRGGGGEVRRAAAQALAAAAATVRDTVALLAEGRPTPPGGLSRSASLLDHAYVQFRTEPAGAPGPDWLVVLAVVLRVDGYASVLRTRHPAGPALPPDAAARLRGAAASIAAAYTSAAAAIDDGRPPPPGAGAEASRRLDAGAPPIAGDREAVLRLADGWGWLHALADDLDLLERACAPHADVPA